VTTCDAGIHTHTEEPWDNTFSFFVFFNTHLLFKSPLTDSTPAVSRAEGREEGRNVGLEHRCPYLSRPRSLFPSSLPLPLASYLRAMLNNGLSSFKEQAHST
jgi:hypothetical protein